MTFRNKSFWMLHYENVLAMMLDFFKILIQIANAWVILIFFERNIIFEGDSTTTLFFQFIKTYISVS